MNRIVIFLALLFTTQSVLSQGSSLYLPPDKNGYDYPQPGPPGPPSRPPAGPKPGPSNEAHEPGMPFDFQYAVNEVDTANQNLDFTHNSNSDGDVTRGEYKVALPDGRTQVVRYTADWKNGYNADVTYE